MDIIQVIIFIIIIVAAIVQQISKAGKEKKTPSPKEVLADMFPEIEQESMEEKVSCFFQLRRFANLRPSRMQNQSIIRKAVAPPLARK